jgi:hypothetical protein
MGIALGKKGRCIMKIPKQIKTSIWIMALLVIIGYQTGNGLAFFTGVLGLICASFYLDIARRIDQGNRSE